MSIVDWGIVTACALAGWGIVSWLFNVVRQQKAPPIEMHQQAERPATTSSSLSLIELGKRWHEILRVAADADSREIERAYHERLAECDVARFSPTASTEEKQTAETQRARVNQAFEFIRPLRPRQ
jgi:hypothetical protein